MYEELLLEELLRFLREDLPYPDITTRALVDPGTRARARIIVLEDCVVAGVDLLVPVLRRLDLNVEAHVRDGTTVRTNTTILSIHGDAIRIFELERTLLNLLMIMCGIATKTRRLVEKIQTVNPKIKLAATRKTHPGLRFFEKYAVEVGGGDTHRLTLTDMVLIKRNHIRLIGSVKKAIELARQRVSFSKKIEIETSTPQEALEAAEAGADIIMLDNVKPEIVQETIQLLKKHGLRDQVLIEVSGGITEENILEYAKLDIDIISTSEITIKTKPTDIRCIIEKTD